MNTGTVFTEEEAYDIEAWKRGVELRQIVSTDGWQLIKDALDSYVEKADRDLRMLLPGDPNVPTAHAALSALDQMKRCFIQDVEAAAYNAGQIPEALRHTYHEEFPENGKQQPFGHN